MTVGAVPQNSGRIDGRRNRIGGATNRSLGSERVQSRRTGPIAHRTRWLTRNFSIIFIMRNLSLLLFAKAYFEANCTPFQLCLIDVLPFFPINTWYMVSLVLPLQFPEFELLCSFGSASEFFLYFWYQFFMSV